MPRAKCCRPRCCAWKSKSRWRRERERAGAARRAGGGAHGPVEPPGEEERDRHADDRGPARRHRARRSRQRGARGRAARRGDRLLRRHGSERAARIGGKDGGGKPPGRAALRRDLHPDPELPKPVVAVVHGRALAGGCGLATACDLLVAAESAKLGYPEVQRGFVPAIVMTLLKRTVGEKVAFDLAATGRILS